MLQPPAFTLAAWPALLWAAGAVLARVRNKSDRVVLSRKKNPNLQIVLRPSLCIQRNRGKIHNTEVSIIFAILPH